MADEFRFSKFVDAHRDSIRAVTIFTDPSDNKKKLITVSRDAEAKIFLLNDCGTIENNAEFVFYLPNQISTVCVLANANSPAPVFVFGCLDGHIYLYRGYDLNAFQNLTHHSQNVCVIKSDPSCTRLVSGSWDKTAVIYKVDPNTGTLSIAAKITSHTQSVMDVAFVGNDQLLTASSDKSIILWNISASSTTFGGAIQLQTFVGHEDCVRGLLLEHDVTNPSVCTAFYSISNDQTVRKWNLTTGQTENVYVGHPHFIFDIARLDENRFVTCGENNTVCIWNKDSCHPLQVLKLPVVTIWSVEVSPDGRVLFAASSDGKIYVYTNREELFSSAEFQAQFEDLVSKTNVIPYEQVSHLKLYEQSSLELIPAKVSGERRLIRSLEDNTVLVYEWTDNAWKSIGHVPNYQHTDVVNPSTGRKFYNDEYYDEVLAVKLNGKNYKLPFNRDQDPWIVATVFIQQNQLDHEVLDHLVRCIVSYAGYKPTNTANSAYNMFPLCDFQLFTQIADLGKLRSKFQEFNETSDYKISADKLELIGSDLQNPTRNPEQFVECYQQLFNWKTNKFIIYDMLRITLADKFFNTYFLHRTNSLDSVFGSIVLEIPENNMPLQLTSLRVLCNLFASVHGAEFMYRQLSFVEQNVLRWKQLVANRNVHHAYASLWFNYSVLLVDFRKQQDCQLQTVLIRKLLEHSTDVQCPEQCFDICIVKLLHTFGNLLASPNSQTNNNDLKQYHQLIQSYPKQFPNSTDIRYCLQKINIMTSD